MHAREYVPTRDSIGIRLIVVLCDCGRDYGQLFAYK